MAKNTAHVVLIKNPFKPLKDAEKRVMSCRLSIRDWLRKTFKGFKEFSTPTICLLNGKSLMRAEWDQKPKRGDVITFAAVAGIPAVVLYWISTALLVASVVMVATMSKAKLAQNLNQTSQGQQVYSLQAQRNQVKIDAPIEVVYGAPRQYPSYAAAPYNQYQDNKQYLFQLFCLGQGEFDITAMLIGDTPVTDYKEITTELVVPGDPVTLFPTDVHVSDEVGGIELYAPNEPGSGSWIEDSPGDPDADPPIPASGHYASFLAGPFTVNPSGTTIVRIEFDMSFPGGLFIQLASGGLDDISVTVLVEKRTVDNSGSPTSGWSTLATFTKDMNTNTPQRFTTSVDVAAGRYQVRASRTSNKDLAVGSANTVMWEQLRGFGLGNQSNYGNVTLIAVKALASNNLNDASARQFNVIATRKLPYYSSTATVPGWKPAVATRSIVWAFCDVFRSAYGAQLADEFLDMTTLEPLNTTLEALGWHFDWIFDQPGSVWETARVIAAAARAVPMVNGSLVTIVRDVAQTVPVAVFNPSNMRAGSFKNQMKLWSLNPYDGLYVTYIDPDTYKPERILCTLAGESGTNPEQLTLQGVMNRDQAYQLGMYHRSVTRYIRENILFETGMEGFMPNYGDMVAVSHDVVRWGQSGLVTVLARTGSVGAYVYTFTLSDPVTFVSGTYKLLLRKNNGGSIGPITVLQTSTTVVYTAPMAANADLDAILIDNLREPPSFIFGLSTAVGRNCRITGLAPTPNGDVQITAVPYDARLYTYDGSTAPAIGDTNGNTPTAPDVPQVQNLIVYRSPGGLNTVVASWLPVTSGVDHYTVEISYDGFSWQMIDDNCKDHSIVFTANPDLIRVRVAAVGRGTGPYAYWVGIPNTIDTSIVAPTGLTLLSNSTTVKIQPSGEVIPQIKVSWTASTDPLVINGGYTRIQYKLHSDSTWIDWNKPPSMITADYIFMVVLAGLNYDVRIRAENQYGYASAWVEQDNYAVAGDLTAPSQLAVPALTAYPGYVRVTWAASAAYDIWEYKVYRNTSNSMSGATFLGETGDLDWDDPTVVAGSSYYYFILPVDTSENTGAASPTSGNPSVTAIIAPAGAVPSAPSAPTLTGGGSGTYNAGDGTVFSYLTFTVAALPAGAVWQNLLYQRDGAAEWLIAAQVKNTGGVNIRVDDLSPGVNYNFGLQAFNGAGGTAVIAYASNPATAPGKTGASADPSGFSAFKPSSGHPVPASYFSSGAAAAQMYGSEINCTPSAAKDIAYVELGLSTSSGAFTGSWLPRFIGNPSLMYVYTPSIGSPVYIWCRTTNTSGVTSTAFYTTIPELVANFLLGLSAGNISTQDSGAIAVTGGTMSGMTSIASSSTRRLKKRIRTLKNGLRLVNRLRGVRFTHRQTGRQDCGLIAEEVQKVLPSMVVKDEKGRPASLEYGKLSSVLVEAVKELDLKVKRLERRK